jgi:hypothetical protein
MLKRSLVFVLMIAAAAGGYAEDAWKGHQPKLVPQQSGTTGQAELEVRMWLRLMAVRPGDQGLCREPKVCSSATCKA